MNHRFAPPLFAALILTSTALALPRPLKAVSTRVSSVESNRPEMRGENAVDGNPVTRWSSDFAAPQWIEADFGEAKTIAGLNIRWEDAFARTYQLLVSPDGRSWRKVFEEASGDGGLDGISLGAVTGRYARLVCLERGTRWGFSIFEMEFAPAVEDDGLAPAPPGGLGAVSAERAVFLSWQANAEPDLEHYNVYRSAGRTSDFTRVNQRPVRNGPYADETAPRGETCRYRITAVDAGGRESAASAEASAFRAPSGRRGHPDIPACAWRHDLGDIPEDCISTSPDRGVAIGGFGAGSFLYTISGRFGPFQTFDSTLYKPIWLDAAAFHVYEKVGRSGPTAKCLATVGQRLSAWDRLRAGEGVYHALQPKGWVTYSAFQTDIRQAFFTPILPNNYKETSYPVGTWTFRVHNPSTNLAEVSVMLTFPGVYVGEDLAEDRFENRAAHGDHSCGVVLRSRKGLGEWCIAVQALAGSTISRVTSWNANSDGSDIWNEFRDDGVLVDSAPVDNAPAPT